MSKESDFQKYKARKKTKIREKGEFVRVWTDGSCDTNGGGSSGWGTVIQYLNGDVEMAFGILKKGLGAYNAEAVAVAKALAMVPIEEDVIITTDCKSLSESINRYDFEDCENWPTELRVALEKRKGRISARWMRRKSKRAMSAAHHLANVARLLEPIGLRNNEGKEIMWLCDENQIREIIERVNIN